jgi:hypothetical protein
VLLNSSWGKDGASLFMESTGAPLFFDVPQSSYLITRTPSRVTIQGVVLAARFAQRPNLRSE